jgi:hypothetical protein
LTINHRYEGDTTSVEKMHLEYQELVRDNPGIEAKIKGLPGHLFSGKANPDTGIKAVFLRIFGEVADSGNRVFKKYKWKWQKMYGGCCIR